MAARYWVGTDTSWNTAANWSATSGGAGGAGVPTSADDVTLDSGTQNCTLDVNATYLSLTSTSGYSGAIDSSTYNMTCTNDFILDHGGGMDFGSGSHAFNGFFDVLDCGNLDYGTSSIDFGGVETNCLVWSNTDTTKELYNCTVSGNWTLSNIPYGAIRVQNQLNVTGTYTNNATSGGREVKVTSGALSVIGTLAGSASLLIIADNSGSASISALSGTLSIANTYLKINATSNDISISSGNYSQTKLILQTLNGFADADIIPAAGLYTFTDIDVSSSSGGDIRFVNSTNNPDITINGDVGGAAIAKLRVTKGAGTITASGAVAQDWNFNGESVEDIDIDKSAGTLTLSGGVDPDTVTLTNGNFDINGNTVTTIGNYTMAAGTTTQDTAATGSLSIGGIIDINGSSVNQCTWTDADISSLGTGTNDADWCTVSDSNNSSGKTIDASTNCTDGTGNTGWDFGSSPQYRKANIIIGESMNMGVLLQI